MDNLVDNGIKYVIKNGKKIYIYFKPMSLFALNPIF